jgi:hypothetical protein
MSSITRHRTTNGEKVLREASLQPSRARGARRAPTSVVVTHEVALQAGEVTGGHARRAGTLRLRDSRRDRAGSSAFAPAAHGGLPPVRYPGHRPSGAGAVRATDRARARAPSLEPSRWMATTDHVLRSNQRLTSSAC